MEYTLEQQEKARKAEDEDGEMYWSLRTLGGSNNALVLGPLDSCKFDFEYETVRQVFERQVFERTFRK